MPTIFDVRLVKPLAIFIAPAGFRARITAVESVYIRVAATFKRGDTS
jgi:hypothetical protein